MFELRSSLSVPRVLEQQVCLHLLGFGFEDRCLSYPEYLVASKTPRERHIFYGIHPGDDGVDWVLRAKRSEIQKRILQLLPAIQTIDTEDIEKVLANREYGAIMVDLSTMPRKTICVIVEALIGVVRKGVRIFFVYTYPQTYYQGALQNPAPQCGLYYNKPWPVRREVVASVVMAGFDSTYAALALTWIEGVSGGAQERSFWFGFPGARYEFYQRAVEAHLDLLEGSPVVLYPQNEVQLTFMRLREQVEKSPDKLNLIVPLGPRVTVTSAALCACWARRRGLKMNVLLPATRRYSALRSSGCDSPLVEELFLRELGLLDGGT